MRAWRIAKAKYAKDLSGYGASIAGGRWNHQDLRVVYAGLSPGICCLETFVHQSGLPMMPMKIVALELPDDASLLYEPAVSDLPAGWNTLPADRPSMDFGSEWLREGQQLGLIVPSVVMPLERNILLNPQHPAMSRVKIVEEREFRFDDRMFSLAGPI